MTVLLNLVLLLNLPVQYQLVLNGLVIVVAVALYSVGGRK
jgi:ribose/xylose/arabinose/galactoside ABC-type transport system permease subunit